MLTNFKIHKRKCGHVILRDVTKTTKAIGESLEEGIELFEECRECLMLKVVAKDKKPDPKEIAYVNQFKYPKKTITVIPKASIRAEMEIEESHVNDEGVVVIDKAKLLNITLIPRNKLNILVKKPLPIPENIT